MVLLGVKSYFLSVPTPFRGPILTHVSDDCKDHWPPNINPDSRGQSTKSIKISYLRDPWRWPKLPPSFSIFKTKRSLFKDIPFKKIRFYNIGWATVKNIILSKSRNIQLIWNPPDRRKCWLDKCKLREIGQFFIINIFK